MRNKSLLLFCFLLGLVSAPTTTTAQGCSDAGLCTMHALKVTDSDSTKQLKGNQLNTGISFGGAQYKVGIFTPTLEYIRQWNENISSAVKMAYGVHWGELGNTSGFSDLTASLDYTFKNNLKLVIGFKVPLSDANIKKDGLALPMSYQSSLGTFDLITALNYQINKWSFSLGYQQPLRQNSNTFLLEDYSAETINQAYLSTNEYWRAADLMLRLNYRLDLKKSKTTLFMGMLPIYHLANDRFTNNSGIEEEIDESGGLTLNLNFAASFVVAKNQHIQALIGAPVIARSVRPDGLSQFALNVNYSVSF